MRFEMNGLCVIMHPRLSWKRTWTQAFELQRRFDAISTAPQRCSVKHILLDDNICKIESYALHWSENQIKNTWQQWKLNIKHSIKLTLRIVLFVFLLLFFPSIIIFHSFHTKKMMVTFLHINLIKLVVGVVHLPLLSHRHRWWEQKPNTINNTQIVLYSQWKCDRMKNLI